MVKRSHLTNFLKNYILSTKRAGLLTSGEKNGVASPYLLQGRWSSFPWGADQAGPVLSQSHKDVAKKLQEVHTGLSADTLIWSCSLAESLVCSCTEMAINRQVLGHVSQKLFADSLPKQKSLVLSALCALTCRSSLESTDPLSLPPGLAAFRVKFLVMK